MRKKINLAGVQIGAAALFVGLAGNIQAIPLTLHDYSTNQAVRALDQNRKNQSFTSLAASLSPKPAKGKNVIVRRSSRLGNLPHPILGGLLPVAAQGTFPTGLGTTTTLPGLPVEILPQPLAPASAGTTKAPSAASVPDGGATAAMMAGSVFGLALLRKKLKT
jgi:VPDSG-CTERM motif